MKALFRRIVPKKSPEEINNAATERTRQLHNARFTFRPIAFVISVLPPLAITILELATTGVSRWFFGIFELVVVIAIGAIFISDRGIANSPESVAAKVTRATKKPGPSGGYVIYYAFLAMDGSRRITPSSSSSRPSPAAARPVAVARDFPVDRVAQHRVLCW